MDYSKEYRNFISSHYLGDAVRMTAAILLPALILSYYQRLDIGLSLSVGALCVSLTDMPGPIRHRRNGLLICTGLVFVSAIITGISVQHHWLFGLVLPIFCFCFSMIGVYGARASSIGIAAILIMVLETEHRYTVTDLFKHAGWLAAGGFWYTLLSQLLYSLRPYRLIQQALGEFVISAADYLRAKAAFYESTQALESKYQLLLDSQIKVQEKQDLVAEMIFKTRSIANESTHTSRVLMMIFLDITDLFERTMTAHQDYGKLHQYFDESGILSKYHRIIVGMANELDEIGISLKSGRTSAYSHETDRALLDLRDDLKQLHQQIVSPANIEGFISLRHILDSMDEIAVRIHSLDQYTSFDRKLKRKKISAPGPEVFVNRQEIDFKMLLDNFSLQSNIFRHSVRIMLAAFVAYLIGLFFPLGHSYWILLTVIVILKPAYGITRTRNIQRLTGTLLGAAIGALLLYVVRNQAIIVVFLAISMIGAYSFIRKQYFISVVMITLYVLILFRLLDAREFDIILRDRVLDTFLGSALAFVFSYLLPPVWEHEQIGKLISRTLGDITQYFRLNALPFTGSTVAEQERRLARKNNGVSLANLSNAFNRMLSEPKSKQRNIRELHRFVVASHMLTGHIATLGYYAERLKPEFIMADYEPVINASLANLEMAGLLIENAEATTLPESNLNEAAWQLDQKVNKLMVLRRMELERGELESGTRKLLSDFKSIVDQFNFAYKISEDIRKISKHLVEPGAASN